VVQSAAALDPCAATDCELLRRFARENDQAAFAALVGRHTAMVLGVCRRALVTVQDAEDACQAVFLVLANRAKDGRWQESIANWLYTTARKVAHNARLVAERRVRRETTAAVSEAVEPVDRMTGRELLAALDAALGALPVRYREPLVLCYLEGLTRDEAAARLGIPLATLHTRIDRARKRLHAVLTRAGCTLGAGLLALAVTSPAGASPPRLVASILANTSGSAPAAVGELAKGVAVNGSIHKVVLALVAVVVVALGAGLSALEPRAAGRPADKPADPPAPGSAAKPQPKEVPAPAPKETTITGRVLDPDGKPLPGAKLFALGRDGVPELGATGADGKFAVKVPANMGTYLVARAEGVALDFEFIPINRLGEEVELRLVKDQAIRGRVVDTQGKPVAGATVAVSKVAVHGDSLDSYLAAFKRGGSTDVVKLLGRGSGLLPTATTDKDGRFTISGTGAERLVTLHVGGDGLADTEAVVVNRKDFDPKSYNGAKPEPQPGPVGGPLRRPDTPRVLHGPDASVIVEPEKRIRGRVTDIDTGKPRAGVRVALVRIELEFPPPQLSAVTDAEGKYEIRGARKAASYTVAVDGDPGTRHVAARTRVDDTAGYEPLTADIKVKKGVVITGKVFDTGTKKPVRGYAMVAIMSDNKFVKDYPEFGMGPGMSPTDEDGTFRVVTVPGPVLLMGGASGDRDALARYKRPVADPKYPQYFHKQDRTAPIFIGYGGNNYGIVQGSFCKVLEIKAGAETVTQDVLLEPVE
jgi:RNA polymerase sigma factor (sigma-70 family)